MQDYNTSRSHVELTPVVGLLSATKKGVLRRSQSTPARPRPQRLLSRQIYKLPTSASRTPASQAEYHLPISDRLLPGDRLASIRAGSLSILGNIPELPSTPPPPLDKEPGSQTSTLNTGNSQTATPNTFNSQTVTPNTAESSRPINEVANTSGLYKKPDKTDRPASLPVLAQAQLNSEITQEPTDITPASNLLLTTVSTQTPDFPSPMNLRPGSRNRLHLTKTLPFLFVAIFLLLLGIMLMTVGVMMEYHWVYHVEVFYKPYWSGALVTLAGVLVAVFCCVRTSTAAVVVTLTCIPALAATIFQVILAGLMARAVTPQQEQFFCSSAKVDNYTLSCSCTEDIAFSITVKSVVSSAAVNDFCEEEMRFIFELMLAVTCVCVTLILLLFVFIFWVFCAVTNPKFSMERQKSQVPYGGSMSHSEVQRQRGTLSSPMVFSNSQHGEFVSSRPISRASIGVPSRAPSRASLGGLPSRPQSMIGGSRGDEIPANRSQSISAGLRPVVSVQQRNHSGFSSPALSRAGTFKSNRAAPPLPPPRVTLPEGDLNGFKNTDLYPLRAAGHPVQRQGEHRTATADSTPELQGNNRSSVSRTPVLVPRVVKQAPKYASSSLENFDDADDDNDGDVSSEDNTNEVILDFKASPKQENLRRHKNRRVQSSFKCNDESDY